jgi:hypothetical protein
MNEQTAALGLEVQVEPLDDIPLLLGIIDEMGIRELVDGCVKADRHWQGVSIGTVISIWLCYLLSAQDHRLVAVREWVWARRELFNRALGIQIRQTECSDDRLATILSLLGQTQTQLRLDEALADWDWLRACGKIRVSQSDGPLADRLCATARHDSTGWQPGECLPPARRGGRHLAALWL